MTSDELDEIDLGILHMLQQNARNMTLGDMESSLPVSDATVGNRIASMEEKGIIEGYVPIINYEAAGFPLWVVFECTAPIDKRADIAMEALESEGVVHVQEMIAATGNVRVTMVAKETTEIASTAHQLVELGLTIENEVLSQREYIQPFGHFGAEALDSQR